MNTTNFNAIDVKDSLEKAANKLAVLTHAVNDPDTVLTGFFDGMYVMVRDIRMELKETLETLFNTKSYGSDVIEVLDKVVDKLTVLNQAVCDSEPKSIINGFFEGMYTMLTEIILQIRNVAVAVILAESGKDASKTE